MKKIALAFNFGGKLREPNHWFVYELFEDDSSGYFSYSAGNPLSHPTIYGAGPVSVPEPGTLALLNLVIIGLTLARRRSHTR